MNDYISAVEDALECADNNIAKKLPDHLIHSQGMATPKNRIFLNQLLSNVSPNVNYLEIGIWYGSTFFAAIHGNEFKNAYAIDNYCEDFGHFIGKDVQSKFVASLKGVNQPVEYFDEDSFNLKPSTKKKIKDINIYLYDGGHAEEEQKKALTYYINNMANRFIFIVDDWTWDDVQSGTMKGIEETKIKIVKSWERTSKDWWNGYYIAVCEK